MATKLTTLEQAVLEALKKNADEWSGGDFALVEEMKPRPAGLTDQGLGGVLTSLQNKGLIEVDITYVNGDLRRNKRGTKVTQVTFNEA